MHNGRRLLLGALLVQGAGVALAAPPRRRPPLVTPLPAAPASTAPGRKGERAALEAFLSTSERPPTAADLSRFGKRPDRLLISLADDAAVDPLLRARATSALAHTPTPEARRFLTGTLAEKGKSTDVTDRLLLRRAAVALGWHGGSNTAGLVGPLLDHEDPEVRVDAGVALGLSRLPEAIALLRTRLGKEGDARVRGHLGRQLQSLERSFPGIAPPARPGPPLPTPPPVGGGRRSSF